MVDFPADLWTQYYMSTANDVPGDPTIANGQNYNDLIDELRATQTFTLNTHRDNLVLNATPVLDTAGWVLYADAPGTTPVDGVGGVAGVTWDRSSSSPISLKYSFLLTKPATDQQGNGVAYTFTVPSALAGQALELKLEYLAGGSYVTGDVRVYIYDISGAQLITPLVYAVPAGNGVLSTSFTASATGQYRLVLHVASTSALAWTLKVNQVRVGSLLSVPRSGGTMTGILGLPGVQFDVNAADPAVPTNGLVKWDTDDECLKMYTDIPGVAAQIPFETWWRVVNKTGATIPNGTVVCIDGTQGNRTAVAKLDASQYSVNHSRTIGVATHDILDNQEGIVTVFGAVREYDTSGFQVTDVLWANPAVPGGITNVKPSAPDYEIRVGYPLNSTNNGSILVSIHHAGEQPRIAHATGEPTGFETPSALTVTYDSAARTVTMTQTGGVVYWWHGTRYILASPWTSPAHAAGTGRYFLMAQGSTISWSNTVWDFYTHMPMHLTVVDTLFGTVGFRETHGTILSSAAHQELHELLGTYRVSGGALTTGTYTLQPGSPTDADNTPGVDQALVADEDNRVLLPALVQGTYRRAWITSGSITSDSGALPFRVGTTYPLLNIGGADVEASGNKYMNLWAYLLPVTGDAASQAYRVLWVQPQAQYSTLAEALLESVSSLGLGNLGGLLMEFAPHARITLGTSASYLGATGRCRIEAETYLATSRVGSQTGSVLSAHAATHTATGSDPLTLSQSQVTNLVTDLAGKQSTSEKGQANGYASLDSGGTVPLAQTSPLLATKTMAIAYSMIFG